MDTAGNAVLTASVPGTALPGSAMRGTSLPGTALPNHRRIHRAALRASAAERSALCRYRPSRDGFGARAGGRLAVGFGRRQSERGARHVGFGVGLARDRPLGRLGESAPGAPPGGCGDGLGGRVGSAVRLGGRQREGRAPGVRAHGLRRFGRGGLPP
ncbi:hypothetical protein ABT104_29230, partial [Streptomyces mobaraensis]